MCFSVISLSHHSTPLLWHKMAILGQKCLFPPGQLGSDQTPAGEALVKYFLLRADLVKNRILWSISKYFLFLPPAGSKKGFFSDIHYENLAKLLEAKFTKVLGHPMTGSPWSFYLSDLSTLSLRQFISSSGFPSLPPVPIAVSTHGFLSTKL